MRFSSKCSLSLSLSSLEKRHRDPALPLQDMRRSLPGSSSVTITTRYVIVKPVHNSTQRRNVLSLCFFHLSKLTLCQYMCMIWYMQNVMFVNISLSLSLSLCFFHLSKFTLCQYMCILWYMQNVIFVNSSLSLSHTLFPSDCIEIYVTTIYVYTMVYAKRKFR